MIDILKQAETAPRLSPLTLADLDEKDRSVVEGLYESADTKNILMTLAKHPQLLREWLPITRYIFNQSKLNAPDIELICLRTTWCCGADYEYTHHAKLAAQRGLSGQEIDEIPVGAQSSIFNERQQCLLQAVDSLLDSRDVNDVLWRQLETFFSVEQVMDIVVTCGNYATISMMQRVLRVQLEGGINPHRHFLS